MSARAVDPLGPPNDGRERDVADDRRILCLEALDSLSFLDDQHVGLVPALSGDRQAQQELALLFHGLVGAAAMAGQQDLSERARRCEDALAEVASSASWPGEGAAARLRSACRALADGVSQLEEVIGAFELGEPATILPGRPSAPRRAGERPWPAGWLFHRVEIWLADASCVGGVLVVLERIGDDVLLGQRHARSLLFPLSQLVRNALAHGAQLPAVRHRLGKPSAMRLRLACQRSSDTISLTVEDDGPGLAQALPSDDVPCFGPTDRHEGLPEEEAIFLPGLTTANASDPWAGRGLGLPLVRRWVEDRRGSLKVTSRPGEGFRVDICVPLH